MLSILLLSKSLSIPPCLPPSFPLLLHISLSLSPCTPLLLNCLFLSSPLLTSSSLLSIPFLSCSPNSTLSVLTHLFSVVCLSVYSLCMAPPSFDICHFSALCSWIINRAGFEAHISVVPNGYRGRLEFQNFCTSFVYILSIMVEKVPSNVFDF